MSKQIKLYLILAALLHHGNCETLPSADVFLTWLLNVTSNELENIANSFNFHDVSPADIKFHLYTDNKTTIMAAAAIDPSRPTKIIIHGWLAAGPDEPNRALAQTYHRKGPHNTILVDWSEHSKKIYMHASSSTKAIGEVIGDYILKIVGKNQMYLRNIHLIGHSLGAHVAGFAGKRVYEKTGLKVGRITGLDVAAPMFEVPVKRSSTMMLSKSDADFVDAIHTNVGFLGVSQPIGTADFYVESGGPIQPGCFNLLNIFDSIACSHFKAHEYFMESIVDRKFEALSCSNSIDYHILLCINNKRTIMGEDAPRNVSGTFYLETDSALPYSKLFVDDKFRRKQ